MKDLFATRLDRILTVATLTLIVMLLFPPVGAFHENGYTFFGYEFAFDLHRNRSIDMGRLFLQLSGLASVLTLLYRVRRSDERPVA